MVKKIIGVLLVLYSSVMLVVLFMSNKSNTGLGFLIMLGLLILGIYLLRSKPKVDSTKKTRKSKNHTFEEDENDNQSVLGTLNDYNNKFFNGLKENAINNAISKSKPPKKLKMKGMDKLSEIANLQRELKDIIEEYDITPEEKKQYEIEKNEKKGKIDLNLTYEEVVNIFGKESKKDVSVSRGKKIIKLYFYEYKNRLGNTSYEFEVTLKDDKVYGWKDLLNVSTGKGE
jgi:hypothetical protein